MGPPMARHDLEVFHKAFSVGDVHAHKRKRRPLCPLPIAFKPSPDAFRKSGQPVRGDPMDLVSM